MCGTHQDSGRRGLGVKRSNPRLASGGLWCAWGLALLAACIGTGAQAQILRLGPFQFSATGTCEFGYDSNVDDAYPSEADPNYQKDDFYWMPGLRIQSQPVATGGRTLMNASAAIAYKDYFERDDLDTELYSISLNLQAVHPRLTFTGLLNSEYTADGAKDTYVPGGAKYDPTLTHNANFGVMWNYRKVRLEAIVDFLQERHDKDEYKLGDKDELTYTASAYWDAFTWGSFFYTWEKKVTTFVETDEETDETTQTFGVTGAIPVEILRRPNVTYSFGISYEDEKKDPGEREKRWEPTHTVTAIDEFQLSKALRLAASATWEKKMKDDEVSLIYNIMLEQLLGPRARHAVTFSQEPRSTLGSNSDTETTTYSYDFNIRDLFVYNLSFAAGVVYEESTPLGPGDAETEKTTTWTAGLTHNRQLSRKLSRALAYTYTSEDSNFHTGSPKEKHLITYSLSYAF